MKMDPMQYLSQKRAEVEREVKNIKDFRLFDSNYVPEQPIGRPEMDKITRAILKYERSQIPTNIFAFGSRGCGKTVTVKYLQRIFNESAGDTRILYVNVRENNTSFKMLANILGITPRGVSLSEVFQRFQEKYSVPTILILDEVDCISDKDRQKEILYLMSRSVKNYMLIMLANNSSFLKEIDVQTRSSLQPVPLHFKNYDAVQMCEIIKQRADGGLKDYSESLLREISALVVKKTNSDVRAAIKTLYYVATEKHGDLQNSFQSALQDLTADLICDLNYNNLLALKAASRTSNGFVKDVYQNYSNLCAAKSEKPFCYAHFCNNLSYLQSLGLIMLISTKVGKAYANRINLLFDSSLLKTASSTKLTS
ncbi:hypothetical protein BVX94_02310 [bacterium B17]|nr:hypothetical protein BVX94_02310 [bacterium B17]